MGFPEILSIIMLVLSVGFSIWDIIKIIKKSRYVKNTENKIRLKNKFNIWIILIPIHLWIIYARMSNNSMYRGNPYISENRIYYEEKTYPVKYYMVENQYELAEMLNKNYQRRKVL